MLETISYSPKAKGFNSFHDFQPDEMVSLNGSLYTFKNGNLYKHDVDTVARNEFYGVKYDSKIITVLNPEPTDNKLFKTLSLEGDSLWKADLLSDQDAGVIETSFYVEKEGDYYAYIRSIDGSIDTTEPISTQGVGALGSYAALVMTFGFNISAPVAVGDTIYRINSGSLEEIGTVASHTNTTITLSAAAVTPVAGDVIVAIKDSVAESRGVRGYYMRVELTNDDREKAELFTISSELFKSHS